MKPPREDAIRKAYEDLGVEGYYQKEGSTYSNPHFAQIRQLLIQNRHRLDYSNVLDFCCGSGEVSIVLRELGCPPCTASDPYTAQAYQARLGNTCHPWSFLDVVRGRLEGQYNTVICSFAMHLCSPSLLFPLAWELLGHASRLVIITPHKRPELEQFPGIQLEFSDFALTERGKKVCLKVYRKD